MSVRREVLAFYESLNADAFARGNVSIHNPFDDERRRAAITAFCERFYDDAAPRIHLLGINPNQPADTSSGVHYTDGYALDVHCGIPNGFSKGRELTSRFFYLVVEAFGGAAAFYRSVFAWSVMPVCVTEVGEYRNYYDERIYETVRPLVRGNMEWLRDRIPGDGRAVVLGTGENKASFERLDGFPFGYRNIVYLPHPRWILQYHSNELDKHVERYVEALS